MTTTDIEPKGKSPAAGNIYLPNAAIIKKIVDETTDTKTFHFNFKDEKLRQDFTFQSGQFALFSILGTGEAPFAISSSPTRRDHLEFAVRQVGRLTKALHRLGPGSEIGVRGPYGNGFPLDSLQGKNLVFVAGGIGLSPLRSLIWNVLDNRDKYNQISIIYGARSPSDLSFRYDLAAWEKDKSVNTVITIDKEHESWSGRVGLVPIVLAEVAPSADNTVAIVCGPPIMIRFTFPALAKLGFSPQQMITTLEKRMKCGLGKCGRCNIGNVYVCRDGPVFSYAQIKNFVSSEY
ncbi:MAG: FAD/NAD(P)-binding protein [Chloroflexota bacterium]